MPRVACLDIFKGILIILVVAAHTNSPFNIVIYSFHMPAWFLISGYLYKKRNLEDLLVGKVTSLLVPFWVVNIVTWAILLLLQAKKMSGLVLSTPVYFSSQQLIDLFIKFAPTNELMGATWFLPVLFGVSIVGHAMIISCQKIGFHKYVLLGASFFLMLYGQAIGTKLLYIDLLLVCQFFYISGYILSLNSIRVDKYKLAMLTTVALGILLYQQYGYDKYFSIIGRTYNNIYLFILFTCAGSFLVHIASEFIASRWQFGSRLLQMLGQQSLGILLFHFIGFKLYSVILVVVFHYNISLVQQFPTPLILEYPLWYMYLIAGIIFSLCITYGFDKIHRKVLN
jgi:fucose 4-O-acetylase-like acetyltransferase